MTAMQGNSALEQRQVRAAKNQSLFREVNDRIEELQATATFVEFACECVDTDCTGAVPMTHEEYERMRRIPTHFVVLHGHVIADVERVVEETDRYVIVEKLGAGGPTAIRFDPRSRPTRR